MTSDFRSNQFVLDTPVCCVYISKHREVIKRLAANQLHGSFTPTVVLTEPPSLPATDHGVVPLHARTVTGREYH